jgi:hypothetical protein
MRLWHVACKQQSAGGVVVALAKSTATRTLQIAASVVRGSRTLQDRLGVPASDLAAWLSGEEQPPREIFLRAVEIILEELDDSGEEGR